MPGLREYWQRPDLTAAARDEDGFWGTGDLGPVDADGYLRVTGRIKDIIIRGGFNISAREVEESLLTHPDVANVALIGLPDPGLGERACAVVEPRGDARITIEQMREHLTATARLAVWKVPERAEFVTEWPKAATGNIQKFVLRDRYRAPAGRPSASDTAAFRQDAPTGGCVRFRGRPMLARQHSDPCGAAVRLGRARRWLRWAPRPGGHVDAARR